MFSDVRWDDEQPLTLRFESEEQVRRALVSRLAGGLMAAHVGRQGVLRAADIREPLHQRASERADDVSRLGAFVQTRSDPKSVHR